MTYSFDHSLEHLAPGPREILRSARNVHSQAGEDGIIDAILQRLPERDRWCVEFGAWDGTYLSNTRRLIDEDQYHAVEIEANPKTFLELRRTFLNNPRVTCISTLVGFSNDDNLDSILANTDCPINFDFLSIDIDGNDIHVWEAMRTYRPKVICIENNPTIPTSVLFAQPRDPRTKWGSSVRALFEAGQKMNYRFICANSWNCFFVASEYWTGEFAETVADLPHFRLVEPNPVYAFSGYDGSVLLSDDLVLNWHGIRVDQSKIQILPRFLRRYPDDYNFVQRVLFSLGKKFPKPWRWLNR